MASNEDAALLQTIVILRKVHQWHVVIDTAPALQIRAHIHLDAQLQRWTGLPVQLQRLHGGVEAAGVHQPATGLRAAAGAPETRFHTTDTAIGIALGQQLQVVTAGAALRWQCKPRQRLQ